MFATHDGAARHTQRHRSSPCPFAHARGQTRVTSKQRPANWPGAVCSLRVSAHAHARMDKGRNDGAACGGPHHRVWQTQSHERAVFCQNKRDLVKRSLFGQDGLHLAQFLVVRTAILGFLLLTREELFSQFRMLRGQRTVAAGRQDKSGTAE